MTLPRVVILELGDGIELEEALVILGQRFPKETGTVVHAAIREKAVEILRVIDVQRQWPPPLQHK
jgi:hypothetical protein